MSTINARLYGDPKFSVYLILCFFPHSCLIEVIPFAHRFSFWSYHSFFVVAVVVCIYIYIWRCFEWCDFTAQFMNDHRVTGLSYFNGHFQWARLPPMAFINGVACISLVFPHFSDVTGLQISTGGAGMGCKSNRRRGEYKPWAAGLKKDLKRRWRGEIKLLSLGNCSMRGRYCNGRRISRIKGELNLPFVEKLYMAFAWKGALVRGLAARKIPEVTV